MHFTLASAGLPCKFKRLKSRFEWQVYNVDELLQHIQTVWDELDQRIIDKAIKQWRTCLRTYVNANYGHFENKL